MVGLTGCHVFSHEYMQPYVFDSIFQFVLKISEWILLSFGYLLEAIVCMKQWGM